MPKKKRNPKPFSAVKAVKDLARERIGSPRASRVVLDRKKKNEKYKPRLKNLIDEE
jgi:hypothetical protein